MCHNDIYVNFFEQALVNENNPKRAAAMTKNKAEKLFNFTSDLPWFDYKQIGV